MIFHFDDLKLHILSDQIHSSLGYRLLFKSKKKDPLKALLVVITDYICCVIKLFNVPLLLDTA